MYQDGFLIGRHNPTRLRSSHLEQLRQKTASISYNGLYKCLDKFDLVSMPTKVSVNALRVRGLERSTTLESLQAAANKLCEAGSRSSKKWGLLSSSMRPTGTSRVPVSPHDASSLPGKAHLHKPGLSQSPWRCKMNTSRGPYYSHLLRSSGKPSKKRGPSAGK